MDSVRLEHRIVVGETLEEERHQRRLARLRHLAVSLGEASDVRGAVIGRQLHADQQHARSRLLRAHRHRIEVGAHGIETASAQAVVAAELDDRDRRMMRVEKRREAGASACRRVAADARVDHAMRIMLRGQPPLQ